MVDAPPDDEVLFDAVVPVLVGLIPDVSSEATRRISWSIVNSQF